MPNNNFMKRAFLFGFFSVAMVFGSVSNAEVKYTDFNKELVEANSMAKTIASGDSANRVAEFDSEKLLRCWQRGQLISTDRGWKPANGKAPNAVFKKGSQEMFLYEFGETFCVYTGE